MSEEEERTKAQVERLGRLLLLPLADVNVAMGLRSFLLHMEKALEKAAQEGDTEPEAMREGQAALRDLLVIAHAATGAWLAGLDAPSPTNSGPLQEAEVGRPRRRKRTRRTATSDLEVRSVAREGK